ncbi:SH2 domain protein [Dictyocaulus viviparus]|uniref:Tyrosine-protein kinase n=1 Tax=Dictyocaulus viviparus TaxID=29172 RepID=A0A0D8XVJ0_DICVI|nr:SH2 domain protein [Dictyocaulus viviparus]
MSVLSKDGDVRSHSPKKNPSEIKSEAESHDGVDKEEERVLREFEFYHGFLPREDLFCLLKYVGEFLIRISEVENDPHQKMKREIILSVVCEGSPTDLTRVAKTDEKDDEMPAKKTSEKKVRGKLKNVIVRRKNGKYLVEMARLFESIPQLINHYRVTPGKLNKITFILKYPIKQQPWEYNHGDVQQGRLLGEGAFGEVRAGTLKLKSGKVVDVAIKVTKGCSDLGKAKIKEMMKEARLMRNFRHRNVVRIYGVAVDEQPLYIILELVTGGALNTFLREHANQVEVKTKLDMCLGAALGVEYLHSNQCMHRDLAARNCLITPDRVVKISDFGLSRLGVHYKLRTAMKLPIKWLAPETITMFIFSLKTDVFSFGVLAYEIFADGAEPWDGQTNAEVKVAVIEGKCVTFPRCTPEKLRRFFVERVFAMNPAVRATMTEVVKYLQVCGGTVNNSRRSSQMSDLRHPQTESRRNRSK